MHKDFIIIIISVLMLSMVGYNTYIEYNKYDSVKLDTNKRIIKFNKTEYKFSDIKAIEIIPDSEQPSILERAFNKSLYGKFFSTVKVYLINNTVEIYRLNRKRQVKNIINKLSSDLNIIADRELYEHTFDKAIIISLAVGSVIMIITLLIITKPH